MLKTRVGKSVASLEKIVDSSFTNVCDSYNKFINHSDKLIFDSQINLYSKLKETIKSDFDKITKIRKSINTEFDSVCYEILTIVNPVELSSSNARELYHQMLKGDTLESNRTTPIRYFEIKKIKELESDLSLLKSFERYCYNIQDQIQKLDNEMIDIVTKTAKNESIEWA